MTQNKQSTARPRLWPLWLPAPLFRLLSGRRRDVLFFWVPKCAGMSIYTLLVKYGCPQEQWLRPFEPFSNRGIATFGHVDVRQMLERGLLSGSYFRNAFKFAFVRNPFDRLVSLFFYLKKIKCEEVSETLQFEEFCRKVALGHHPPVGLYNYQGLNQCNPMVDWLLDGQGRLMVDFLGRYESLTEDFAKVCQAIGIREEIPHENRTSHRPYREYYDAHTRALVEQAYRRDLDRFEYSF